MILKRIINYIRNKLHICLIKFKNFLINLKYILFDIHRPLGHYYSPIISKDEIRAREAEIFGNNSEELPGIELKKDDQLALLKELSRFYKDLDYSDQKKDSLRYYYANSFYKHFDGIILYLILRYFEPNKIIEIGSGFSSAISLDVNEQFFDGRMKATFIDPYPERLFELLTSKDRSETVIIDKSIQEVQLEIFSELSENDILFIDSSHVSKTGSDVNYIMFNILPRLSKGVIVHFHDIFKGFQYPKEWVYKGINWNESYLLRAFLSFNSSYNILMFNSYVEDQFRDWIKDHMPKCLNSPGQSIWLKRV